MIFFKADEKMLVVMICAVIIQIPITLGIHYLLTHYTREYIAFCVIAVIATYLYSKSKNHG